MIPNALGNEELVLVGAIADDGSGRSGMSLEYDGLDWTGTTAIGSWPGQPAIQVNWVFTATHEIGAGNHIFRGRAQDVAGNEETPYEIARVLWYPQTSPDIAGSSLTASPATDPSRRRGHLHRGSAQRRLAGGARIGRRHPARRADPCHDTLAADVSYDPAAANPDLAGPVCCGPGNGCSTPSRRRPRRICWRRRWRTGPPSTLSGPTPTSCRRPSSQPFLDHEQTVTVTAGVAVNPSLPAGADLTPPWVSTGTPDTRQGSSSSQVRLDIAAAPDARWMYLREWTPDPTTGAWTVARSSGWIDYTDTYTWTLSAGQGVRYLGVWVADAARNVSTLDERSLVSVNRIDGNQILADGQRVQYRGDLEQGTWLAAAPDDGVRRSGPVHLEAAQRVPAGRVSATTLCWPDRQKTWATGSPRRAAAICWRCRPLAPASISWA